MILFNIGDVIVYGAQGVCKIDGFQTKQIGKEEFEYYVLKPVYNENATVFVPIDNQALVAKMRSVLTKPQVEELAHKVSQISPVLVKNDNDKREQYKTILASGDCEKLISLIKTIRFERDERRQNGKKLNMNDEQTLRKAEILLYNEFGFVYGVEPEKVKNIINF